MTISHRWLAAALGATLLAGQAGAQTAAERLDLPAPDAREGQTLPVDGAEIFYAVSGEGDPIVLLHGYPLSGALFERVRDRLDDNHQVVTIDHRGFGQSSTSAPVDSVSTYASDALAVLAELGIDSAVIGGMSMGGPIMFEMYRQNPDVFAGMIAIDTNHKPANEIETGIWEGAEAALNASGEVGAIIPFLIPNMLTGETRLVEMPAQADYLTLAMEAASLDGAIGGAKVLANRPDSTDVIEGLEVPLLVLVGREDSVYPVAISEELAGLAPNAEIVVIPAASHAAIFERPDAAADAILNWMNAM